MNAPIAKGQELVLAAPLTPAIFASPETVDDILAQVEAMARGFEPDISTAKGRAAIASFAYKLARTKTSLDELGKDTVADWKRKAGMVDAERRKIRERIDVLQEQVRQPLTDWENAEKKRVDDHEAAIKAIFVAATFDTDPTVAEVDARIAALDGLTRREWQEFEKRAAEAMYLSAQSLVDLRKRLVKQDAERAELERLRKEAAERQQRERDEAIAREAAEKARQEAENKAAREAEAAAAKAREEQERVEREKREAEQAAARAEAERKAAEEREAALRRKAEEDRVAGHQRAMASIRGMVADACSPFNGAALIRSISAILEAMPEMTRDWQEFGEQARTLIAEGRARIAERLAKVEAQEKESNERAVAAQKKAAEEKAEADRQAAVEAERKRVADAKAKEDAETAKREANKAHQKKVNNAAKDALVAAGLSEQAAVLAITTIAQGKVPRVTIAY